MLQEKIDNLNSPIPNKRIEFVDRNLPTKKILGPFLRKKECQFYTISSKK
jgi:hypothetical protein